MITLKSCPICDSNNFTQYRIVADSNLISVIMHGVEIDVAVVTRYCVCQNCHLIFQNPRLSDTELDKYYGKGSYRQTINSPPEGMDAGEENRAKVDAEIIRQRIGEVSSHLDVGCGRGYLLEAIGASVKVGIELDFDYVRAKSVEVYSEMNKIPQKSFDLVTAIHVLEHVPAPFDYLKDMAKFVNKRGHLVIEVPSWKTRGGPLGFAHLSHFEPDVLKLMCAQVGLQVIHLEFTPHLILICEPTKN